MLGGSQHVFLTEAAANSAGIGRAMGRGKVSVAIKKLRDTGLVEKSEEYGFGAYAITAAGRDVLSKLESMQREIARRAR